MCCLRQLLYPSEDDLHKLTRFLVERLTESTRPVKIAEVKDVNARGKTKEGGSNIGGTLDLNHQREKLEDPSLHNAVPEAEEIRFIGLSRQNPGKAKLPPFFYGELFDEEGKPGRDLFGNEETAATGDDKDVQKSISIKEKPSMVIIEKELRNEEKVLTEEVTAKTSELQHLEEELELLKAATEMAFGDQNSIDFCFEQLKEQVDAKRCNITELKSQWDAFRMPLEDKKRNLEESLYANIPDSQEKLQKLRELEHEKQLVLSEITKREEEHSKLSADLEKQPKLPSRTSYIERIKEITKSSQKQDADIKRILKETRELQLESNSIQDRLHRTYAVLDEVVCREAKRDPVVRKAYSLLTSLHDFFGQISEKILTTDRISREMTELEKKLAAMASRSLNVDKLQADLDAIVKENECLELRLAENP
ncbi:PREDICTED: coiled-coil domain-containing protein 22 isoform X2 [Populus euphratica]|uniref:Coiled-coil domain-containing protein 22 isoform X2 n=1 Tax=Populus euphratica TaxID=75702 RepID=A0AAJ6Y1I4_POPEU|nr:PREDICTED: coiled-coil domain-containing protein 22 isoform X2 [Populus euphratica]